MKLTQFILLLFLILVPQLHGQYTYVDLHPDGYDSSKAFGIHNDDIVGTGRVTGNSFDHALLWKGVSHTLVDLHPLWAIRSVAFSVYGEKQVGHGKPSNARALLWSGSAESVVDLTPISGYLNTEILDLSETHQVGFGGSHALLWQGTAESVIDLNPVGFNWSSANAISGTQQVGYGGGATTGGDHALLWSGTPESVVDLNPSDFTNSWATDVFNGQQVGYGLGPATNSSNHALLWNNTAQSVVDLNPVGFSMTFAVAISSAGQLGWGSWWDGSDHILLWSGSAQNFIYLDSFFPPGTNFANVTVTDIGDNGVVVGYTGSGTPHKAFMLIPNSIPYCTSPIEGDFNNDCVLNIFDFVIFSANWMECNLEPASNCF